MRLLLGKDSVRKKGAHKKEAQTCRSCSGRSGQWTVDKNQILVAEFACEGGGTTVYRFYDERGEWKFFENGDSIGANGELDNREWTSEPRDSLTEVLDNAGFKTWYLSMSVIRFDPDFRGELLDWARNAHKEMAPEFGGGRHSLRPRTPEEWVDRPGRWREIYNKD